MYHTKINTDKRNQLKRAMDDFTTFNWGEVISGQTAFDKFGAFIVGGKDALKFYNGPGFSNKYITTQFQSQNSTLQSVEFKTMTVDFTMGVYWFTIEEYRQLLLWLHPYEISQLSFSFAPEWYYLAKLSNISDSTRHILGKDSSGNYRYYTEIKLTFEIQGEPCLHHFDNYTLVKQNRNDGRIIFNLRDSIKASDLDTPFDFSCTLKSSQINESCSVALNVIIPHNGTTSTYNIFNAHFKYLNEENLTLHYNSAQGLIFTGNQLSLLSSLTTAASGRRILDSLIIGSFKLPGVLESGISESDFKNILFEVSLSSNWQLIDNNTEFIGHALTNVI